ncbi:aldo/keto reductase [Ottowia sp.]|jgi:aryl-alcohol dehydrogenase-like predicted oxidoreductase|uniref:aldo/keto reductase n=1 Tax=Ottowia sp. TaxID=1898956 RepID=UPI0025F16C0B|nr:aldo/keto reductase [Ottowia sp.]MBK6615427.1 aldo/keto reductase [Ottowia sp.]MBK6746499.1 aldo/keto reductase [Ottowia sp.]
MKTHPVAQNHRRQWLATAATLGVAPWLLSACAQTASAPRPTTDQPASAARRRLGPLEVFPIGLGVQWHPSGPQGVVDLYQSRTTRQGGVALIRRAADLCINFFDTAEVYGPFMSEELLGEALQGSRRDRAVISTKFGFDVDPTTGQRRGGVNSRPAHIRQVVEAQLRRLRTDRIDLLYQHRVDPNVPIEDVAGTIKDLVRQGKVLHYGLSEPGLQTIRRAHKEHPVAAIQNEYSMLFRGPEAQVLPLCEELGIGFVPWSPLGMGFLAGTVKATSRFEKQDFRAAAPRFAPDVLPANMALAELVQTWAARKNVTPPQLSLAWLTAQKPWIVPIPGTTNVAHLEENVAAASISFSAAELKELNAAVAAIPIRGARLPPAVLSATGVEAPPKR